MTIKSNVFGIRCAPGSGGLAEVLRVFGKAPSFVRTYDSTLGLFSADGYPVDTEIWHSYKSATPAQLDSWLRSVPADRNVVLVPHHEPENDAASGYTTTMHFELLVAARRAIDISSASIRSRVRLAHVSSGAAYVVGGPGSPLWSAAAGAAGVDLVGIDSYQTSVAQAQPLAEDVRFQRWALAFRPGPHQWAIPEYGRMALTGVPATDAANAVIRQRLFLADLAYTRTLGGLDAFGLWWSAGLTVTPPKDWQFRDAGSIKQWKDAMGTAT